MFLYLQVLINKKDGYKDTKNKSKRPTKSGAEFKRVSISCLIQGINNCLQINTYCSCIVIVVIIDWQVTYYYWQVKMFPY